MVMVTNGAPGQVYLRQTLYQPGKSPITTVIQKEHLNQDIHIAANETRTLFGDSVDVEIFVWDGDLISATAEADRRARAGRIVPPQRYKDTLHDFLITVFFITRPHGVIAPKSTTPLTSHEIRPVLEAVRAHPKYADQTIVLVTKDQKLVRMTRGTIEVSDLP